MKKVTFAILGLGNRGSKYAEKQLRFPDDMQVVAIADPRRVRLDAVQKFLNLPESSVYSSGEEMLKQPKLADIMIIASQDAQHRDHAVAALEKGYDLLLEKPIAANLQDCKDILEAAHKYGRRIIVCHVLRYTVFYRKIKELIANGTLGKVESISAEEQVGYYHIAHSYVRGNWHKQSASSPMILAKCCHDMDLFLWLTGQKCVKVSSFGSLDHFKASNCPEGATERCTDGCPHAETCPYNAPKFYLERMPGWPTNILHPEPTEENVMEILRTGDYGRCVYKMDNDVVDHQVVNLLLEDGCTVNFSMCGFTKKQDRHIHVMGTKGDLLGDMRSNILHLRLFGQPEQVIDLNPLAVETSGHGGGDFGLVNDVIRLYRGDDFDTSSITVIDRSMESHFVAFAAEESRVTGKIIDMDEFLK